MNAYLLSVAAEAPVEASVVVVVVVVEDAATAAAAAAAAAAALAVVAGVVASSPLDWQPHPRTRRKSRSVNIFSLHFTSLNS